MSMTFENAPLIELIAELRWNVHSQPLGTPQAPPASIPLMALNANHFDEFFMRFGGEVYKLGYERAERLLPPGFPLMLFQPVYRYRKSDVASVLYQAGPGLFSANAIPPYRSWDDFSPVVKSGIKALLKTRSDTEKEFPFSSISLRYIDAFGPALTQGRDVDRFLREVLGLSVELPDGISKHIAVGQMVKPSVQLALPLANGMTLNVGIGEGLVNNETSIIMDTTVSTTGETPADENSAMRKLNIARDSIHEMFFDLTKSIRDLMKPTGGS